MAATDSTGAAHPSAPWYRGSATDSVHRRRALGLTLLLVLTIALLAFPKVTSPSAVSAAKQVTVLPGETPMNTTYSAGTTVNGVQCGPGVRQVPWSAYADGCEPKWTGNNGGATAPGVTGTTITLTYRQAATAVLQELYTLVPPNVVGTNAEAIHTLQSYINIFNKDFELYGRHVVLTPFNGQGNFINEDTGTGAPQAEADAVTVADNLHAFADMSLIDSSVTYTQDLQAQKVVAFGLYSQAQSWYAQNAPYQFTPGPNCSKSAQAIGALFGKQLKGLTAQFAGGALKSQIRKLGIFYTNVPTQYQCEQEVVRALAAYGVTPAAQAALTFDLSQLPSEAATAVAEMKAAGVTTIICVGCDPISPRYYFASATQDNYHPEWYFQSLYASNATATEQFIRLFPADQRDQIITAGVAPTSQANAEAVRAYNLGNTTPGVGIIPSYNFVYGSILEFFDALQAAGPDLTAANLEAAMKSIPQSSPGGELGQWNGIDGPYDPASGYQLLHWSNAATSPADGKSGTYEVCNRGTTYTFAGGTSVLPSASSLRCRVTPNVPTDVGKVPSTGAIYTGPSTGSTTSTTGAAPPSGSAKQAVGSAPRTTKARG